MAKRSSERPAPVVETAEILVRAPVEVVWGTLTDFAGWPKWNGGVSSMAYAGPLRPGTVFTWVGGGAKITSRLEEVDEPGRIVWSGRTMGIRAFHAWTLAGVDGGTRVSTVESFDGLVARVLSGVLGPMLRRTLRDGVTALKNEAESRATASRSE